MLERIPTSPKAEESVVGSMIAKPEIIAEVLGATLLTPAHFFDPGYRALYEEILKRHFHGARIDGLILGEELGVALGKAWGVDDRDALERVQTMAHLASGSAPDVSDHAELIKREAAYRELLAAADDIRRQVLNELAEPEDIAASASQATMKIATDQVDETELVDFAELGDAFVLELRQQAKARRAGLEIGAYFGLGFIDRYTLGMRPGELMFLAGEPGAGKSSLGWEMIHRFASKQAQKPKERQVGALLLSMEMGSYQAGARFAQALSHTDGGLIREASVLDTDLDNIEFEFGARRDIPLYTNFATGMRLSQMRAFIVEAIRKHNVGLVIIDHWKYVQPDRRFERTDDEDEVKARFLKQEIAKQLGVVVICLAHTVKPNRENPRPRMADLRGSGYIQAHADYIAFIFRPHRHASREDIDNGTVQRTQAELLWEKARMTPEGTGEFYFDPSKMYFGEAMTMP